MAKCVFIVQGEGRGHMSQAIALKEHLDGAGFSLEAVFVGKKHTQVLPDYFVHCFGNKIRPFHSPYFLNTPNRKGIYVGRTLLFNLIRSPAYLREVARIRRTILSLKPEVVVNFYDVVGALALRKLNPAIKRIGIGHHFYLHYKNYFGLQRGLDRQLLAWHTRIIMRSCDRVLALSYREERGNSKIEIVPPLIRKAYRELTYQHGSRYLVYFLKEGYIYDLIRLAREDPEFLADVFTEVLPGIELPAGIRIFPKKGAEFREKMASCKGLIESAGFDTIAEAAYHGIPQAVIPVRNHFEQRCNSLDVEASGIGVKLDQLVPGLQQNMKRVDPAAYRKWADRSGELFLKNLKE
jgi:uncharacterized protein (TIGR00661 family)